MEKPYLFNQRFYTLSIIKGPKSPVVDSWQVHHFDFPMVAETLTILGPFLSIQTIIGSERTRVIEEWCFKLWELVAPRFLGFISALIIMLPIWIGILLLNYVGLSIFIETLTQGEEIVRENELYVPTALFNLVVLYAATFPVYLGAKAVISHWPNRGGNPPWFLRKLAIKRSWRLTLVSVATFPIYPCIQILFAIPFLCGALALSPLILAEKARVRFFVDRRTTLDLIGWCGSALGVVLLISSKN